MMSRRVYACFTVAALAVAALCFAVNPAWAQRGWRGYDNRAPGWNGWGDRYGGTGWGFGYGSPYYSGWYGPENYSSYGWGTYPNSTVSSWTGPEYSGWGNQYAWSSPSNYGEGMANSYYEEPNTGMSPGYGQEGYGAMNGGMMDNRVLVTVRVPPNAQIWFDNQKTNEMGMIRSYISPPLNPTGNFVYVIRAHWTQNGQPVEKTRRIEVAAGDRLFVNFNPVPAMGARSGAMGQPGMSGQYGTQQGVPNQNGMTPQPNENGESTLHTPPAAGSQTTTHAPGTAPNQLGNTPNAPAGKNVPAPTPNPNQTKPPQHP
jgi:uncharacterized protein (TIGR03000 family)